MNRILVVASMVAFVACRPWDDAYNARVDAGFASSTDGGGGPLDSGNRDDAGASDAGLVDAGIVDAGACSFCLVASYESGQSIRGLVPKPQGAYFALGRKQINAIDQSNVQIVSISPAAFSTKQLPFTFFDDISAYAVGGAPGDYVAATYVGLFHVVNDVFNGEPSTIDCGWQNSRAWYSLEQLGSGEMWASGASAHLCRWSLDAGFEPVDRLVDAGVTDDVYGQAVFATGDQFYVGGNGLLAHIGPDGGVEFGQVTTDEFDLARGLGPSDVWAVGDNGVGARWLDGGWHPLPRAPTVASLSGAGVFMRGFLVEGPNEAWLGGSGGNLLHWVDGGWVPVVLPNVAASDQSYDYKSIASHGPHDFALSGTHVLSDGGEAGFVWLYQR